MSFFNHLFYGYFLQFDTLPIWLLHLKIPSTHDSLIFLFFVLFYKNIQQKVLFKIFIFWWEGKRKMGISTSNHNILLNNPCNNIFLFFCNLGICVNLSILCTHSWSNTFIHKKCNKFIFFLFFVTYILLVAHHEFPS